MNKKVRHQSSSVHGKDRTKNQPSIAELKMAKGIYGEKRDSCHLIQNDGLITFKGDSTARSIKIALYQTLKPQGRSERCLTKLAKDSRNVAGSWFLKGGEGENKS